MKQDHNSCSGFSIIETLLGLVIVVLISIIGWQAYTMHSQTTTNLRPFSKSKTNSPSRPTSTITQHNPYVGWHSYTTKYEKMKLQYPSGWTLIDHSNVQQGDNIILRAKDNLEVNFIAGAFIPLDTSNNTALYSQSITFLNQPAKLIFYSNVGSQSPLVSLILVALDKGTLVSKNVLIPNSYQGYPNGLLEVIISPNSSDNAQTIINSSSYQQAKLIIESMKY